MGGKARQVFFLFLTGAKAHMFFGLTHCTLPEVERFPASRTRFHFSTCSSALLRKYLLSDYKIPYQLSMIRIIYSLPAGTSGTTVHR